jgi:hypothetical protein
MVNTLGALVSGPMRRWPSRSANQATPPTGRDQMGESEYIIGEKLSTCGGSQPMTIGYGRNNQFGDATRQTSAPHLLAALADESS